MNIDQPGPIRDLFLEYRGHFREQNPRNSKDRTLLWFQTHNLLLDGDRPETLMDTEEGRARLRALLKEMRGEG